MVCHRTEPRPPLWKPLNVNSTYPCCQVTVLVTGLCHSGSKISWQNGRNQNKTCAVPDLEVRTKKQQHVSVRSIFSFLLQGTFVNTGDSPPPPHTHIHTTLQLEPSPVGVSCHTDGTHKVNECCTNCQICFVPFSVFLLHLNARGCCGRPAKSERLL